MSTAITEYKVDMREIVCQFCPHPQYPDEGYYQIVRRRIEGDANRELFFQHLSH